MKDAVLHVFTDKNGNPTVVDLLTIRLITTITDDRSYLGLYSGSDRKSGVTVTESSLEVLQVLRDNKIGGLCG